MNVFVIYVIKTLLLPIASLVLLGLLGVFLLRRHIKIAKGLISFSLVMLLLLSLPVVAKYLAATQEIFPPIELKKLDDFSAQAIVVLGGGISDSALEYIQHVTLSDSSLARVRYAAILAKQTNLPILVSGGKVFDMDLPSEAEIMSGVLNNEFKQAVRWQDSKSRNTVENASYTQKILSREKIQRIILVTHALHMQRAVEQFLIQGFHVMPAPTVFLSKSHSRDLLDYLPKASALDDSSSVIHEVMGRLWYKIRH